VAHLPWVQKKFFQCVSLAPRFLFFSIIWGICFSFKVNPNGLNTVGKVWARPERLLFEKPQHGLLDMDFDPS
jgi:hypothetical protein